ncbi:UNVERIFIED_CONTAM: Autophagy protein 5 [Sesamum radiatum]|uniref:Autophagy protein 5 n=1 Tax=Sesamum radiatum TaxID=300843 RepID=A0AAW2V3R4_SESRA
MVMGDKGGGTEAQQYVWGGAIPLQIHLHDSEVTTLPPPPPALILAPRIGYLPLLVPQIKPFFSSSLPPGVDTVWFEYKGLPLKWYIPTGVLFDLLCAEPERPWNLTEVGCVILGIIDPLFFSISIGLGETIMCSMRTA